MTLEQLLRAGPQPPWLRWLFLIGLATAITRLVLDSYWGTTATFYIAVPYLIGLLIYVLVPQPSGHTKLARAGRHFRSTAIVMLASSFFLFEGFICVLFAAPIYFLFAGIAFATLPAPDEETPNNKLRLAGIPAVVALVSLEGLTPALSLEREGSVSAVRVIEADVAEIKHRLAEPIVLEDDRSAFLSVFPLPHTVVAGTLEAGDVHTTHYTYKRWFFGNTHNGQLDIEISEVSDDHVKTTVLGNDAYFSHYLTIHGTRIDFRPLDADRTEVTLTIDYRRDLDPAWYFGPLQREAVEQSADYLIRQLMER